MTIDAIVLAAGEGVRMGGGGKALATIHGITFLERVFEACREGGCRATYVVVRPDDTATRDYVESLTHHHVHRPRCRISPVLNPEADRGMFSSVRLGLKASLNADPAHAIVVFPVDFPFVHHTTVHALAHALDAESAKASIVVRPRYHERTGHPIVLSRGLATAIAERPVDSRLDTAIEAASPEYRDVTVVDIGILRNLNYPSDLEGDGATTS